MWILGLRGLVELRQHIKFLVRITYNIFITIAFQIENMQTCYSSKFKRYSISVGWFYRFWSRAYINTKCVVPENIHTPPPANGGHFCFRPPTLFKFPFQVVLVISPYTLEFLWFSILVGNPLERIFPSKKLFHYTILQNVIVSEIKWKKIFIHVNRWSNKLNFAL